VGRGLKNSFARGRLYIGNTVVNSHDLIPHQLLSPSCRHPDCCSVHVRAKFHPLVTTGHSLWCSYYNYYYYYFKKSSSAVKIITLEGKEHEAKIISWNS